MLLVFIFALYLHLNHHFMISFITSGVKLKSEKYIQMAYHLFLTLSPNTINSTSIYNLLNPDMFLSHNLIPFLQLCFIVFSLDLPALRGLGTPPTNTVLRGSSGREASRTKSASESLHGRICTGLSLMVGEETHRYSLSSSWMQASISCCTLLSSWTGKVMVRDEQLCTRLFYVFYLYQI